MKTYLSSGNSITKEAARCIKGKNVLDLGAGIGKDALFLAKKGFNVTGVDKSKEAIAKLKRNKKIKLVHKLIEKLKFNKKYDAIFCLNVLHFMKKKDAVKTIRNMKKMQMSM